MDYKFYFSIYKFVLNVLYKIHKFNNVNEYSMFAICGETVKMSHNDCKTSDLPYLQNPKINAIKYKIQ